MANRSKDSEEEIELDYHLSFPQDGQSVRPKNEPVVMLFGWAGSTDEKLTKSSAFYQSKGYITIRYIAPESKIFDNPTSNRDTAYKLLELLFRRGLEQNPIIFHVFSNGGSVIYRHIMELLTDGENPQFSKLKLAGSILDSTLSDPRQGLLASMILIFYTSNTSLLTKLLNVLILIALEIIDLVIPFQRKIISLSTHLQSIKENPSKRPQLFLYYSEADDLLDYNRMEDVIARRQELGAEVWQVCWNEYGPNMTHYKDEYRNKLVDFVKFCVEDQTKS